MASPVETLADALIAFILSLLNDPEAAEGFVAAPAALLASNGLQNVCMADVAAVRPVIVDHPHVVRHENPPPPPPDDGGGHGAVHEIVRMIQQYTTVDARSTIVDQSVNQNIWTEGGDVTQLFDQEAVVASGDESIAAGDDVQVVDSDTDISMGDVSIGNETNDGSFNQTGDGNVSGAGADEAPADEAVDAETVAAEATEPVAPPADAPAEPAPAPATAPPPPADVPEPADVLETDMTANAADSYETDAASATVDDQPVDVPLEDD